MILSFSEQYNNLKFEEKLSKINEIFDETSVPEKRSKKIDIFLGRMQPPHIGHVKIIKGMKNPVILLVKGAKSSTNKARNPFSEKEQIKFLKKAVKGVKIIVVGNGYLPDIFSQLRESNNYEVQTVFAGADRISQYKRQIDSVNKKLPPAKKFDIIFKETERFTSATKVRETITQNNEAEFKKLMPKELHNNFQEMKKIMKVKT